MTAVDQTVGPGRRRISSVDLLRGLVMIVMALDHVRDYWSIAPYDPTDLAQTSPAFFLTRWITHFCAPVFVFLSGSSAWLYRSNRNVSATEVSRFLFSRGLWLVFIEITVVTFSWQFAYDFVILQVIWAIGWSMVFLALLVYLPAWLIGAIGLAMILTHNLLDGIEPARWDWLWALIHVQKFIPYEQPAVIQGVFVGYPLVPWIGVMAVGYVFGAVLQMTPERRDRLMLQIGLSAIAAFLVLRGFNIYGDPGPWSSQQRGPVYTFLSFLNAEKYPPSLLFLLMTLGPVIAIMPLLERWRGKAADVVTVYGRVPFFFYVLHIPLIHLTAGIWFWLSFDITSFDPFNPASWPPEYSPSLIRTYVVWILTVAALYFPCRWFVSVRKRRKDWWLSYL